jgi:hypothetical protein
MKHPLELIKAVPGMREARTIEISSDNSKGGFDASMMCKILQHEWPQCHSLFLSSPRMQKSFWRSFLKTSLPAQLRTFSFSCHNNPASRGSRLVFFFVFCAQLFAFVFPAFGLCAGDIASSLKQVTDVSVPHISLFELSAFGNRLPASDKVFAVCVFSWGVCFFFLCKKGHCASS